MFPQSNTRPSEPISAVKFTSAVKTFAVMFPQTFAVILTGRVKLNVCVVFKSFCRDTCGPPYQPVFVEWKSVKYFSRYIQFYWANTAFRRLNPCWAGCGLLAARILAEQRVWGRFRKSVDKNFVGSDASDPSVLVVWLKEAIHVRNVKNTVQ